MNILDAIINAQDGAAVRQLGSLAGLDEAQTRVALSALVPALAAGFERNLQSQGGLGNLISALSAGHHQQYIDNPASLGDQAAVADGNGILGHILRSKDVSREVDLMGVFRTRWPEKRQAGQQQQRSPGTEFELRWQPTDKMPSIADKFVEK